MKVLHVVMDGRLAGGQLVARQLVDATLARGDEAIVVSPTTGPFTEQLERNGIPMCVIDLNRGFHLGALLALRRLLSRERVDLVHTHGALASHVLSRVAARSLHIPVVTHMHGPNIFRRQPLIRALYRLADNETARWCSAIVCVSDATRAALVAQGIPDRLLVTIRNGLDPPAEQPAPARLPLPMGLPLVVCVGRVEPTKGQRELLESFAALEQRAALAIVGDGDPAYLAVLEREARRLGVGERVLFTGVREDVPSILAGADLLVLPSWSEGFPIAPLEAMAAGLPVVATAVGGTPELVVDGGTGLLVPPRDPRRLAQAIDLLIADPDRSRSLGAAGRRRLVEEFSAQRMVEQVLVVYDRALAGRP